VIGRITKLFSNFLVTAALTAASDMQVRGRWCRLGDRAALQTVRRPDHKNIFGPLWPSKSQMVMFFGNGKTCYASGLACIYMNCHFAQDMFRWRATPALSGLLCPPVRDRADDATQLDSTRLQKAMRPRGRSNSGAPFFRCVRLQRRSVGLFAVDRNIKPPYKWKTKT